MAVAGVLNNKFFLQGTGGGTPVAAPTASRIVNVGGALTTSDDVVIVSGGTPTLSLPKISTITDPTKIITIKAAGSSCVILAFAGDLVEGVLSNPATYGGSTSIIPPQCIVFSANKLTNRWEIIS